MNEQTRNAVADAISQASGKPCFISADHPTSGGCINDTRRIDLEDGRRYFLKMNTSAPPDLFEREADGLRSLRKVGTLRIPEPIAIGGGEDGVPLFLVLEHIETGSQSTHFQEKLGHGLAQLHRSSLTERCGFDHDNYLGSTPQPNDWSDDWVAFWRERRLGFQFSLARKNGHADGSFTRLSEALMARLEDYLAHPAEPPCLLHGDLWGGNVLADGDGQPVLIDPAAYYGRREADLAMTMLFGGFNARFYGAYEEEWPLEPESGSRLDIYKLYHLLNHLNIFGAGYKSGCLEIMRRYA